MLSRDVVAELVPLFRLLNADQSLTAALQPLHTATAHAAYLASFHARHIEDLRGIRESRPLFDESLLRWRIRLTRA
jgi:hypothetical protein